MKYVSLSSAEVKNEWSYTSTPFTRLHRVYGDKFTFLSFTDI